MGIDVKLNSLGIHNVELKLHKDVKANLKVKVEGINYRKIYLACIKIEQALLSIMLTEPSLLPEIMERVSVDDFYDLKHKKIYATLIKLANKEIKTYELNCFNR